MAAPSLPYEAELELNLEFNKTVYIDPDTLELNPVQDLEEALRIQGELQELKDANHTIGNLTTGALLYDDDYDGDDDDDIDTLFKEDFTVPYTLYTNEKAFLRPYTKGAWEGSEYA